MEHAHTEHLSQAFRLSNFLGTVETMGFAVLFLCGLRGPAHASWEADFGFNLYGVRGVGGSGLGGKGSGMCSSTCRRSFLNRCQVHGDAHEDH